MPFDVGYFVLANLSIKLIMAEFWPELQDKCLLDFRPLHSLNRKDVDYFLANDY